MPSPLSTNTPSESTIEQLSNHFILNDLGPEKSWFFIPTKNEEKLLGYDASLQNHKLLVIQYKRLRPYRKKTGGSILIRPNQIQVLTSRFPKHSKPYVFYAFSDTTTYQDLSIPFLNKHGSNFTKSMFFIDAHSIPPSSKSISTRKIKSKTKKPVYSVFTFSEIISGFSECNVGKLLLDDPGSITTEILDTTSPGRISLLWSRYNSNGQLL